jgi:hypothetical protein
MDLVLEQGLQVLAQQVLGWQEAGAGGASRGLLRRRCMVLCRCCQQQCCGAYAWWMSAVADAAWMEAGQLQRERVRGRVLQVVGPRGPDSLLLQWDLSRGAAPWQGGSLACASQRHLTLHPA